MHRRPGARIADLAAHQFEIVDPAHEMPFGSERARRTRSCASRIWLRRWLAVRNIKVGTPSKSTTAH